MPTNEQLLVLVRQVEVTVDDYDTKAHEWKTVKRHPYAFIRDSETHVCVSAEGSQLFADYYGEYRGGYPWIHPLLVQFAESHGMFWEWETPASIGLFQR